MDKAEGQETQEGWPGSWRRGAKDERQCGQRGPRSAGNWFPSVYIHWEVLDYVLKCFPELSLACFFGLLHIKVKKKAIYFDFDSILLVYYVFTL